MARDEDLSLAVLQGVGPFPVGLYQPSVLWLYRVVLMRALRAPGGGQSEHQRLLGVG